MIGSMTVLLMTLEPTLRQEYFALSMALLGAGMGLMASQLGNVILSSVGSESRSEAGACSTQRSSWAAPSGRGNRLLRDDRLASAYINRPARPQSGSGACHRHRGRGRPVERQISSQPPRRSRWRRQKASPVLSPTSWSPRTRPLNCRH